MALDRRVRFRVKGKVQRIGYRAHCCEAGTAAGVVGWVRNLPDGDVMGEVQGTDDAVERFREALETGYPSARVDSVLLQDIRLKDRPESQVIVLQD